MNFQFGSRKSLTSVILGITLLTTSLAHAKNQKPEFVPGEVLVGYKSESFSLSAQNQIYSSIVQSFGKQIIAINSLETDEKIQIVKFKDPSKISGIIATLRNNPGVRYVEPNYIYRTLSAPNDPEFARQWDMLNTGQEDKPGGQLGVAGNDIRVKNLWDRGIIGNRNILVAVIDTGIDFNHPDLAANMYTNPNEVAGNGVDDDKNGVIDDVHGADFSGASPVGNGFDDNKHGTHCAGTIGAVGNNGSGIAGVNWEASMMPVKFLTATGSGSSAGAISSINYAVKMGAKVLSNSWGGGGYSQALYDAIKNARNHGVLFIAAAGNDASDNDGKPSYPASYALDNIVSVAATDNRDELASFSNYGRTSVHVAAPGKNILSTVPNGGYEILSGTSMACPHVSGMAALLWSQDSSLSYNEIRNRLIATSSPVPVLRSRVVAKGRVNMQNIFANFVPPSNEPKESEWDTHFYALESAHPYVENSDEVYTVSVPGAKHIRIVFDRFETEPKYDTLSVEDLAGNVIEKVSGTRPAGYVTDYVSGDQLILRFKSDYSDNAYGFKIAKVQVVR
jgi:thermitase